MDKTLVHVRCAAADSSSSFSSSRFPLGALFESVVSPLRAAGCVFAEEEAGLILDAAGRATDPGRRGELIKAMVARRSAREPLEHVVGWAAFCGLRIAVAPGVFVPRRRTEFLAEQAGHVGQHAAVIVELCCGAAPVAAALAVRLPRAEIHAADIDPAQTAYARRNLALFANRAHVHEGDLYAALPLANHGDMPTGAVQIVTVIAGAMWHALEDDEVAGRGHAAWRPDGRLFISIDSWQHHVFDRLAAAMLSDLPRPLYTLADAADSDLLTSWARSGFVSYRREREYVIPTDPGKTGLDPLARPPSLTILPAGKAGEGPLRELDRIVRAEVSAAIGWHSMPAEILRPAGTGVVDPSRYAVAVCDGRYVGLARMAPVPRRRPRLGLIAVREDFRRRGAARALLAEVLGSLHRTGIDAATAEVDERNRPAVNLFEGVGANLSGGAVELVYR